MNKINKMDRAISAGQSVLSVGKLFLYKFDCEYIIPKWSKNNLQLVYMDTDTIVILIKKIMFMKILLVMLKNGMIQRIMVKDEKQNLYL